MSNYITEMKGFLGDFSEDIETKGFLGDFSEDIETKAPAWYKKAAAAMRAKHDDAVRAMGKEAEGKLLDVPHPEAVGTLTGAAHGAIGGGLIGGGIGAVTDEESGWRGFKRGAARGAAVGGAIGGAGGLVMGHGIRHLDAGRSKIGGTLAGIGGLGAAGGALAAGIHGGRHASRMAKEEKGFFSCCGVSGDDLNSAFD